MADEQRVKERRKRARQDSAVLRWLKQAVSYGTARRTARVKAIPEDAWEEARNADVGEADGAP